MICFLIFKNYLNVKHKLSRDSVKCHILVLLSHGKILIQFSLLIF